MNEKKIPSNQEKDTERFEDCSVSFKRSVGIIFSSGSENGFTTYLTHSKK